MGVKWDDVKVGVSPLTKNIYIGKTRQEKDGICIWTDKSGDKTKDCVKAVMEHMLFMCDELEEDTISYTIEEAYELRFTKLKSVDE